MGRWCVKTDDHGRRLSKARGESSVVAMDGEQDERSLAVRMAVRVEGVVQGVGFRPFVYGLATRLGLTGHVGNDVDGVFAEVEGSPMAVAEFLRALEREPPPLAKVERVTASRITATGAQGSFEIVASDPTGR